MSTLEIQQPQELTDAVRNGRQLSTKQLLKMVTLNTIVGDVDTLPEELATEVTNLNQAISSCAAQRDAQIKDKGKDVESYLEAVAAGRELSPSADVLLANARQDKLAAFAVIETAYRLNRQAADLLNPCLTARTDWLAAKRRELDKIRTQVAKKLEAAGMGIESQPGWRGQPNERSRAEFRSSIDRNAEVAPLIQAIQAEEETWRHVPKEQALFIKAHREALGILQVMAQQAIAA